MRSIQITLITLLLFGFTAISVFSQGKKNATEIEMEYIPVSTSGLGLKTNEVKKQLIILPLDKQFKNIIKLGMDVSVSQSSYKEDNPLYDDLTNFYKVGFSLGISTG